MLRRRSRLGTIFVGRMVMVRVYGDFGLRRVRRVLGWRAARERGRWLWGRTARRAILLPEEGDDLVVCVS